MADTDSSPALRLRVQYLEDREGAIRAARKAARLSQIDVALRMAPPRPSQYVSVWERGGRITAEDARALAEALGMTVELVADHAAAAA